jgi:uncharacterized protein (TIGR00661 family)
MKRKVLLCVLDWGLGHATRSLALTRALQENNIEFAIASSGRALALLRIERPACRFYELPSYNVTYDSDDFVRGILRQLPKIVSAIRKERMELNRILTTDRFTTIISDCRYGCHHPSVKSVFLSHQLLIQLRGGWRVMRALVNFVHKKMISRFDECWVPDYPDRFFSGELSKMSLNRLRFIGPLSTMQRSRMRPESKYKVLAVLSGPEPQRSVFAGLIRSQLKKIAGQWLIVHGLPEQPESHGQGEVSFMTRRDLNEAMERAEIVVARSGYSTVMDVAAVGAHAIFVPTPGQTEQLYLAERLMTERIACCQQQDQLNLGEAINAAPNFTGFPVMNGVGDELVNLAVHSLKQ